MVYSLFYSINALYYESDLQAMSWVLLCFSAILPWLSCKWQACRVPSSRKKLALQVCKADPYDGQLDHAVEIPASAASTLYSRHLAQAVHLKGWKK